MFEARDGKIDSFSIYFGTAPYPKQRSARGYMARDDELVSRIRAALADVHNVQEKRMFGGTAFMVRGKLCIAARPERIMCRIDPALHDAALERTGSRTVVMRGREYRGYVHVDAEVVKTQACLEYWAGLALDYNKRLKASAKKRMPNVS